MQTPSVPESCWLILAMSFAELLTTTYLSYYLFVVRSFWSAFINRDNMPEENAERNIQRCCSLKTIFLQEKMKLFTDTYNYEQNTANKPGKAGYCYAFSKSTPP